MIAVITFKLVYSFTNTHYFDEVLHPNADKKMIRPSVFCYCKLKDCALMGQFGLCNVVLDVRLSISIYVIIKCLGSLHVCMKFIFYPLIIVGCYRLTVTESLTNSGTPPTEQS
jgi:hypothetical protein